MQVHRSVPFQPIHHSEPQLQKFEKDAVQLEINRKPGEPFDVRKADFAIQAKCVLSEADKSQSH